MSIHVCTFFSPFAQSRHLISLSPDLGRRGGHGGGAPAGGVNGLCVRHQNKRNHSRSNKLAKGEFI